MPDFSDCSSQTYPNGASIRPWFAWANSLFAELLIRIMEEGILEE